MFLYDDIMNFDRCCAETTGTEKTAGIIRLRPIGRTMADLSGKAYCNVRKDSSNGGSPGNMPMPAIKAQRMTKTMPGTTQRPT